MAGNRCTDPFILTIQPKRVNASGVVRLSAERYLKAVAVAEETGKQIGEVVGEAFDFAMERLVIKKC